MNDKPVLNVDGINIVPGGCEDMLAIQRVWIKSMADLLDDLTRERTGIFAQYLNVPESRELRDKWEKLRKVVLES